VDNKLQGTAAMMTLIFSIIVLFGWPMLHLLLLLQRAFLYRGIKKPESKKKKNVLE